MRSYLTKDCNSFGSAEKFFREENFLRSMGHAAYTRADNLHEPRAAFRDPSHPSGGFTSCRGYARGFGTGTSVFIGFTRNDDSIPGLQCDSHRDRKCRRVRA